MKPLYRYNPDTDNFERFYPSIRDRLRQAGVRFAASAVGGTIIFLVVYFGFTSYSERELHEENSILKSRYEVLESRVDNALKVMEEIRHRDDNFYRVMMHAEPLHLGQRYAGLDNEQRYREIRSLGDMDLVANLTRQIDLLDRQLYVQSMSFDDLKEMALEQKSQSPRIPGRMPLAQGEYTLASGFGYRRDPVYGDTKFHPGVDLQARGGTEVSATADGKVTHVGRVGQEGISVLISHGYNYTTFYSHLDEVMVEEGETVKRGSKIGTVGNTGKSTGPHLHYEVRLKEKPQNPVNYFFMDLSPDDYIEMLRVAEDAGHVMD